MALPRLSGEFRLYGDPALKFTPNGIATLTQRLVASDQKKNEQTQKYDDTETLWINLVLWRDVAEHFANSFKDKDLVTLTNVKPHVRQYEKDGVERQSFDLKYDFESSVGPSLRFRTTPHSDQAQAQQGQQQGQQWGGQPMQQQPQNPGQWGNQPPQGYPAQGQPQQQQPYQQQPQQPYQQPYQQPQGQPQGQPGQWPGSEI